MADLVYCDCVAGCMFCWIVAGEAPARVVHADDDVPAFLGPPGAHSRDPARARRLSRFGSGLVLRGLRDADSTAEAIGAGLRRLLAHSDQAQQRGEGRR